MDSSHLPQVRIVLTTIDVIDEFGIHNVSTREARRENLRAAISPFFKMICSMPL